MKEIGNIYQIDGKTIIIESFYGKEQAVAVCRCARLKYCDRPSECYRYDEVGKSFEIDKEDLMSAKRINSACDSCAFYRTSMYNNDVNCLRAWCAYGDNIAQSNSFLVDCTKHKTEKEIKKIAISDEKAKEVFNRFFKDCRLVCESGIETKNKAIVIESVSDFDGFWAERLMSRKKFDSLLKEATGNVVVIENFPLLLSKHQFIDYSPYYSQFKAHEINAKALDYDTYVYFCSEFPEVAFLFEDLGVGIFTLDEISYQITI